MNPRNLDNPSDNLYTKVMRESDFRRLSELISKLCGIKMPFAKKTMLEGRLRKRLRSLGLDDFEQYCNFVLSPQGLDSEYIHMVDLVTTNKTDFFREPQHFSYLTTMVLPQLLQGQGWGIKGKLNVWSAGCSTGEEPYTLAMVLSEFAQDYPDYNFSILATDISTRVLDKARQGVYEHEKVEPVPLPLRKKYLLRSKDQKKDLVRIAPELRRQVKFHRLNFMDDDYGIRDPLAIIFCRNVMIYFDRPTQEAVLNRFCRHLVRGGYFFIGHSETLHGFDLSLTQAAPTIYRKL
jgi:chemotaxis protein methyltransferase CheR